MDGAMTRPPTGLTIHRGASLDRADAWAAMTDDERRLRATRAAIERDAESLWDLTAVWLVVRGRAGACLSPHTRTSYRQGLTALLLAWRAVDLSQPRARRWRALAPAHGVDGPVRLDDPDAARGRPGVLRRLALGWGRRARPVRRYPSGYGPTPAWEKRQPYTAAEVEALVAAAGPADRVLILLAAHGGLRVSECLALRWEDVALVGGTLVVRAGKGGKQRRVSLSRTTVAALGALRDAPARDGAAGAREHVIPYRSDERARERLAALCVTVGVEYKGMHAFRHYCGTRLVGEGGDLEMAARHLGHASIETTRIYVKWSDEGLKRTVGEW